MMDVDAGDSATFSAAEAAVYDRQMRLWGVEAQKRLQNSQVFVSGLSALGSELVKNLVLSGMNVTVHDPLAVTQSVVDTQFFFFEDDLNKNVRVTTHFCMRCCMLVRYEGDGVHLVVCGYVRVCVCVTSAQKRVWRK
jgi:molybdopterin/thiamine biosynthesis adenylyltransferase